MQRPVLLLLYLFSGSATVSAQTSSYQPWGANFDAPPLGSVSSDAQHDPPAQLVLPQGSQPGYLLMPDGKRYSIVAGSSLASGSELQLSGSQPAAKSAAAGQSATARESAQADNGTNPAQNATTFIATNEYFELDGDNEIDTTYTRLKFPIYEGRGAFLLEIPFVFFDFTATNPLLPEIGGIGDVKLQVSYNSCISEDKKLTMINFLEFYIPSADNAIITAQPGGNELTAFNLGTGKYVLGPGLGFVYAIEKNFIIAPLYFYEVSVAGDDDRVDIERGKVRVFAMYAWQSGIYALPEFQVVTNYITGNNDTYAAPEVGYSTKRTTLYVKPGIGIEPDLNDRQWGIEFGARVMF
jgi:hypothetical protein